MEEKIIRLVNIELREEEVKDIYFNKDYKFLIKYNTIYQVYYNSNCGFSTIAVYKNKDTLPLLKKGRHMFSNASFVNSLIERDLFVD